jgi:hypothetical protein
VASRMKVEKESEPAPASAQTAKPTGRTMSRGQGLRPRRGRNSGGLEGLVSDRRSKGLKED